MFSGGEVENSSRVGFWDVARGSVYALVCYQMKRLNETVELIDNTATVLFATALVMSNPVPFLDRYINEDRNEGLRNITGDRRVSAGTAPLVMGSVFRMTRSEEIGLREAIRLSERLAQEEDAAVRPLNLERFLEVFRRVVNSSEAERRGIASNPTALMGLEKIYNQLIGKLSDLEAWEYILNQDGRTSEAEAIRTIRETVTRVVDAFMDAYRDITRRGGPGGEGGGISGNGTSNTGAVGGSDASSGTSEFVNDLVEFAGTNPEVQTLTFGNIIAVLAPYAVELGIFVASSPELVLLLCLI